MSTEPDTKDWTWVVERPCPQCGYDPAKVHRANLVDLLHENTRGWYPKLADADYAVRPAPHVWSRLEYASHLRDVHRTFAERVRSMLEQDDPTFGTWDQDAVAEEREYGLADPFEVGTDLVEQAAEAAAVYASMGDDQWDRSGRRVTDQGEMRFTVESLGRLHLHEAVHHLWDVSFTPGPHPEEVLAEPGESAGDSTGDSAGDSAGDSTGDSTGGNPDGGRGDAAAGGPR